MNFNPKQESTRKPQIQDDSDENISVNLSDEDDMTDEELIEMLAGKHRFQDDGKIIHVAIIDYLTRYTCIKRIE